MDALNVSAQERLNIGDKAKKYLIPTRKTVYIAREALQKHDENEKQARAEEVRQADYDRNVDSFFLHASQWDRETTAVLAHREAVS